MSSFALMNLGRQAATVAYGQLQVAGNNIANANTAGYSRQTAELVTTAPSSFSGSGYFGRGVTIGTVTRAQNLYLNSQVVATTSAAAADSARSSLLQQLEQLLPGGETGLGAAATQIFNAFADVAASPADLSARQAVLGRLDDFATLVRASSQQIESLQASVQHDVRDAVGNVNALTESLAKLNLRIVASGGTHTPNDLLDQRDELVRRIGGFLDVQTYIGADGTANVFAGKGLTLVQSGNANPLVAVDRSAGAGQIGVGVDIGGHVHALDIEEGQLGGTLRFQREDLDEARNRLGLMALTLSQALNDQQALGLDLQSQSGQPLLDWAGRGLPVGGAPSPDNARDGNGQLIASVQTVVTDPSALKASAYELRADPANAGQYLVTRLSDGYTFPPQDNGAEIDGFRIEVGAGAMANDDRFTLRPLGRVAAGLTLAQQDPRGIAAANPVTAVAADGNQGTAQVAALVVESAPAAGGYADLRVRFTDGDGGYEVLDSGGGVLAQGSFVPGTPLRYDGLALSLTGFPASGDVLNITPVRTPAANNGNALRFDQLAGLTLVDGQTVIDAHANTLADMGVRVQSAAAAAETTATASVRAREALSSEVGVNLDEEAARLIQYQQSYQAAAKVMQTAQTLLDTIIGLTR